MERLREADKTGLDALMVFAADLKAHQLAQAYADVGNYTLWRDGRTVMGLRKKSGEFRRIQRCYGWPCWACEGTKDEPGFWSTISATNSALMRYARSLPELTGEIEASLVNPKHYYICLWLTREHNEQARAGRMAQGARA